MKRLAALILTLSLLLSVCVLDSHAYTESEQGTADALNTLGMFKGTSSTETVYNLDGELNRYEGYALMIRMLGAEAEAASGYASGKYKYTFTDKISEWAKPYVAYAQSTGLTKGVGDGKQFGGAALLDEKSFLTMSLRALGYSDSGENPDFKWGTVMDTAEKVGLVSSSADSAMDSSFLEAGELGAISADFSQNSEKSDQFTRGSTVTLLWTVLNTPLKDGSKTLSEKLVDEGVYTAEAFATAKVIEETAKAEEVYAYDDDGCSHSTVVSKVSKEPSCTVAGVRTYYCKNCNVTIRTELISALGHSYVSEVTTEPSCTVDGIRTYTCSVCGDIHTEKISATGHGQAVYACDATNHWTVCSDCGEKLSEPVRHSFNADSVCKVCGYGCKHQYTDTVTAPTCTAKGYTTHTCTLCGHKEIDTYTDMIAHEYTAQVTAPTCTAQGYTTHTCKYCGDSYADTYIDAHGHSYVGTLTKKATCTESGTISYSCKYCGDKSLGTLTIPALGHDYELVGTVPATSSANGYKRYQCSRCDAYYDVTLYWTGGASDSSELPEDTF